MRECAVCKQLFADNAAEFELVCWCHKNQGVCVRCFARDRPGDAAAYGQAILGQHHQVRQRQVNGQFMAIGAPVIWDSDVGQRPVKDDERELINILRRAAAGLPPEDETPAGPAAPIEPGKALLGMVMLIAFLLLVFGIAQGRPRD
jgi:hypothetical protein